MPTDAAATAAELIRVFSVFDALLISWNAVLTCCASDWEVPPAIADSLSRFPLTCEKKSSSVARRYACPSLDAKICCLSVSSPATSVAAFYSPICSLLYSPSLRFSNIEAYCCTISVGSAVTASPTPSHSASLGGLTSGGAEQSSAGDSV